MGIRGQHIRFLHPFGLDMPACQVVLEHPHKALLGIVAALSTLSGCIKSGVIENEDSKSYPKIRSGWDMKSVMRSSMLLGSSTNVGNVTLERSIPTLLRCYD